MLPQHRVRGQRLAVRHPAVGPDRGAFLNRLELAVGDGRARQQALVHEFAVCQVQQVVRDQLVVGLHLDDAADEGEVGIQMAAEIRDRGGIGLVFVAEPQPDHAVAFHEGVLRHLHLRRDHATGMRIQNAGAGAVEAQPVVAALDRVADQLAQVQRREPVRAGIADGRDLAVLLAVQHDRSFQDRAFEQAARDLARPGGDVPGVAQIAVGAHVRPAPRARSWRPPTCGWFRSSAAA